MSGFRSILVTGASAGIGRALAIELSGEGVALAIVGRDQERLAETAEACRDRGARVLEGVLDVRDAAALSRFVRLADDGAPLDLVIANAGVSAGLERGYPREAPEDARRLVDVNLAAVIETVTPAIDLMRTRRAGRIAMVGSIAGLLPLPYSPVYCATKSAVHAYAHALRATCAPHGIGVSLIVPGFVTTAMSQRVKGWKPLEIDAERAARIVVAGLARGKPVILFPWLLGFGARLAAALPLGVRDALFARFAVAITEERARP